MLAVDLIVPVARTLLSYVVDTTLGTAISAGTQTATPGSMVGVFPGAVLVVGYGAASQEQVSVFSTTGTTFTATFANSHLATDVVYSPTFSEGYPDKQLWTTAEVLQYASDAQQQLLLETRMLVVQAQTAVTASKSLYPLPADAIWLERVSVAGYGINETTQTDLDLGDPGWRQATATTPSYFWQDGARQLANIGQGQFGLNPAPSVGNPMNLYYSQAGATSLNLTSTMSVPDMALYPVKYGVLSRCYIKDGEQRDPERALYCSKRAEWGGRMVNLFMANADIDNKPSPPFVPLQVKPAVALAAPEPNA